jgi:HAD superfamily hydrolase (TIGR01509 family)
MSPTSFPPSPREIDVLLCDADGNLFPSEELAFVPSAEVLNRFMAEAGCADRFDPTELRLATTGTNFRTTLSILAADRGIALSSGELERWVAEEQRRVTAYLRSSLRPDPQLRTALTELSLQYRLAAVSSSAAQRLDACFEATELDDLFPPEVRFSAEDSLTVPTSKPDPAIYLHAAERLEIDPGRGLAIEDSVPGVQSSVAAGCPTVGNLVFVPLAERGERAEALLEAGVFRVIDSWPELVFLLSGGGVSSWSGHRDGLALR